MDSGRNSGKNLGMDVDIGSGHRFVYLTFISQFIL